MRLYLAAQQSWPLQDAERVSRMEQDRIYAIDGENYIIEEIAVREEYISGGW